MDITIRWKIDDGTLRPKLHFIENILDLTEICADGWNSYSNAEKSALIQELVQQDFAKKVQPVIDSIEIDGKEIDFDEKFFKHST